MFSQPELKLNRSPEKSSNVRDGISVFSVPVAGPSPARWPVSWAAPTPVGSRSRRLDGIGGMSAGNLPGSGSTRASVRGLWGWYLGPAADTGLRYAPLVSSAGRLEARLGETGLGSAAAPDGPGVSLPLYEELLSAKVWWSSSSAEELALRTTRSRASAVNAPMKPSIPCRRSSRPMEGVHGSAGSSPQSDSSPKMASPRSDTRWMSGGSVRKGEAGRGSPGKRKSHILYQRWGSVYWLVRVLRAISRISRSWSSVMPGKLGGEGEGSHDARCTC